MPHWARLSTRAPNSMLFEAPLFMRDVGTANGATLARTLETDVDAIDYAADLVASVVADRKIQQRGLNAGMT